MPGWLALVLAFMVLPFFGLLFVLWLAVGELWRLIKRWLNPPQPMTRAELKDFFFRMHEEEEKARVEAQLQKKRRLMHVLDRCWESTNKGTVVSFSGNLEYTAIEACLDGLIKPKRHGGRIKGYSITHKGRCAYAKWMREQGVMHDWEVSADYARSAAEDVPASD